MTDERREVPVAEWAAAAQAARDEGFDFFDWLSAVDRTADEPPAFEVTLHLYAVAPRALRGLLLTTRVPEGGELPSLTGIFAGAAWHERETHEMFGIDFGDGEQPEPLLLPDGFEVGDCLVNGETTNLAAYVKAKGLDHGQLPRVGDFGGVSRWRRGSSSTSLRKLTPWRASFKTIWESNSSKRRLTENFRSNGRIASACAIKDLRYW